MAFKSVQNYNEERYKNLFVLRDDKDYADVIFLYQNYSQVMMADVHYIKSGEYNGYVQCTGAGCPACAKNIRVQNKLFIPLYNIKAGEIQFWDRTMKFEPQLSRDVFSRFPNPSEFVFRITRNGAAGDINTTYSIEPVGNNKMMSYDDICTRFNVTFPEAYNMVCKDMSIGEMSSILSASPAPTAAPQMNDYAMPAYQITPRGISAVPTTATQEVPVVPPAPAAVPVQTAAVQLPDFTGAEDIPAPQPVATPQPVVDDAPADYDPDVDNVDF